ncbi:hypothetical protein C8R43DRAFT_1134738 [Mycena crocata]|nr:hypothetical protein C8R43DRAFT_1134727 [Mycena crocata]KAJ7127233.1 hypothetical protein C8R43DRAFT_1134738 [Mycena crocata]
MCMLRISERRRRRSRSQSANRNRQCCCTVAVYNSTLKPSVPAFKPCLCVEDLMAFPPSYYLVAYPVAFNSSLIHVAFGSNLKNGINSWACMDSMPSRRCYLTRNEGTIAVLLRVEFQPVAQQTAQHFKFESSWDFCPLFRILPMRSYCPRPFHSRLNILEGCVQLKSEGFLHAAFSSSLTDGCNLGLQSTQRIDGLLKEETIAVQFGSMLPCLQDCVQSSLESD